jgi:hypothetical protein
MSRCQVATRWASSWARGRLPKRGRIRAVSLLLVPSAERGWAGFQAGHQMVVTYSPNSMDPGWGESWSEYAT